MKIKFLFIVLWAIPLGSCKVYLDTAGRSISTDYMMFKYQKDYNEFDYFSKVNAVADNQTFYTTHFSIRLPKNIVYWKQLGNKFYYEYDSKQLIYIYTAYKNEEKESNKWELKDIGEASAFKYLEDYWIKERDYPESYFEKKRKKRVTKLYTDDKYDILLYNIKEKNLSVFLDFIKSFKVKNE
jgi:hypothetical protein